MSKMVNCAICENQKLIKNKKDRILIEFDLFCLGSCLLVYTFMCPEIEVSVTGLTLVSMPTFSDSLADKIWNGTT